MKKLFSLLTALIMIVGVIPTIIVGANESNTFIYNGHYYKIYEQGKTWNEAKAYCESVGGHLVTVTSDAEQMAINSLLINANRNSYWIGAEKIDGNLFWITGEAFYYSNFAKNQPDNYMNEKALMVYRNENPLSTSALGEWNDLNKNGTCYDESFFGLKNFGFICEWESSFAYYNYTLLNRPTKLKSVIIIKTGKKAKITWQKTSGAKGYQVKWAANKKFKKAKKKFTKKNSIILKKLKKRKYYIKVRAYKTVNGKKVYGKWSKVKVIRR